MNGHSWLINRVTDYLLSGMIPQIFWTSKRSFLFKSNTKERASIEPKLALADRFKKSEDLDKPFKFCLDHWWHMRSGLMIFVQPSQPKISFCPSSQVLYDALLYPKSPRWPSLCWAKTRGDEKHFWRTSVDDSFSGDFLICPLVNDHIAGWNISIFNRKYIFKAGPFSSQLY